MRLTELRVERLRCIDRLEVEVPPGWSAFIGPNGAGKTSLLEAVYLLSHGRSFRGGTRDALSTIGSGGFSVFGRFRHADGREHRLGLARQGGRLEARIDGETAALGSLVGACAVVCFEPGSHELVDGASEGRRSHLDWGVFHVEHGFLREWRRYQRALRQRNAALREGAGDDALAPWENEMAAPGESLDRQRRAYIDRLRPILAKTLADFVPELGTANLLFERGWPEDRDLAQALAEGRQRDRDRGHTRRGPHRADWTIGFEHAPRREHLSRGQAKLCALAFILAQASLHAGALGDWPVLCFDDLASELDEEHQQRVLAVARASGAQVLLSGTALPSALAGPATELSVFHVEQGRLRALL
ncbi:MAG: DNA replication/repair protein RecF [Xanthomonadales bacterium]|nr:DNA replication/repair protein RecF [Xanthomonadales bacterium]